MRFVKKGKYPGVLGITEGSGVNLIQKRIVLEEGVIVKLPKRYASFDWFELVEKPKKKTKEVEEIKEEKSSLETPIEDPEKITDEEALKLAMGEVPES